MGWENYIRQNPNYLEPLHVTLILVIFGVIILASFIGGCLLFLWDFVDTNPQFNSLLDLLLKIFQLVVPLLNIILSIIISSVKTSFPSVNITFSPFNIPHPSWNNEAGYWGLVGIPFILWLLFFLYCWVKGSYVKNLDQPKKLNKFNKMNIFAYILMIVSIMFVSFWEWLQVFLFFRVCGHFQKHINRKLKKKHEALTLKLNTLSDTLNKNNIDNIENIDNIRKELNDIKNKLKNLQTIQFDNIEFLPSKTNHTLNKLSFFLVKLYEFVIFYEGQFSNDDSKNIYRNLDYISREIITLQRINKWSNHHFRFEGVFEDVLNDMWK